MAYTISSDDLINNIQFIPQLIKLFVLQHNFLPDNLLEMYIIK